MKIELDDAAVRCATMFGVGTLLGIAILLLVTR